VGWLGEWVGTKNSLPRSYLGTTQAAPGGSVDGTRLANNGLNIWFADEPAEGGKGCRSMSRLGKFGRVFHIYPDFLVQSVQFCTSLISSRHSE
jgi:hypothetical protein